MSHIGANLNSEDFMAITRAMDANGNNRIDAKEATVSYRAHNMIGNSNGVAGTRELATSLEKGDVFLNGINREAAEKIGDYFSKREINYGKKPAEWQNDAWISKADLDMSPAARNTADINNDGKVSRKEFVDAIAEGRIKFGNFEEVQTPSKPSHDKDPFSDKKPSNDYKKPVYEEKKPSNDYNNNPFDNRLHDNTPKLNGMFSVINGYSSEYEKQTGLQKVAKDYKMNNADQTNFIRTANTISSEYSKQQVLETFMSTQKLDDHTIKYTVDSIFAMSSDFTKQNLLIKLADNQNLSMPARNYIAENLYKIDSDYSKKQVLNKLF